MTSALPSLAVTGATGHVGGLVARQLADAGTPQRLLVRSPGRAPELPGAHVVESRYADDDATRRSLDGVEVLLMVSGSESADRLDQHRAFVDAARAAGVGHVVYTSFVGAAADCTFTLGRDHWATEQHLLASGLRHTFLRDSFYTDFLAALPGEDGVIRGPAGTGRVAAVTRADVARVAATVLLDPASHVDASYDLTGPEALTFEQIARVLSEHTGRTISYHDETVEEAYASRRAWDAPQWQYDAWVSTYTAIAAGELARVSGDVRAVTGAEPESLRQHLAAAAR